MRVVAVLAALASGCIATTNLGEGTTTKRRVLDTHYVGDVVDVGPPTVSDSDVRLPVRVDGSCDVKSEVRTAQVMRQKRVGFQWLYWISGGVGLAAPFGTLAVLMDDPPGIYTVLGLTGVGFLAYGIYGAVRHGKTQNRELSARVDTRVTRERCAPRTSPPAQIAVSLPTGKRLDAATSGDSAIVPTRELEIKDASEKWSLDVAGLHAEWSADEQQREHIANAVARYKPRLIVEAMRIDPPKLMAGDTITIRATIRNVGGSASVAGEPFIVTGPFNQQTAAIESLPPQGTQAVELSATVPIERDGKLVVHAYVTKGLSGGVDGVLDVARKPRPSLALYCTLPGAAMTWKGARTIATVYRTKFKASCKVANLGDAEASAIEVAVSAAGFEPATQSIPRLAPLASTVVTLETSPTNAVNMTDLTFTAAGANAKQVKHTRKVVVQ
jgi:hypothetical protein